MALGSRLQNAAPSFLIRQASIREIMKLKFGDKRSIEYAREFERKTLEKELIAKNNVPKCDISRRNVKIVSINGNIITWSPCNECCPAHCEWENGTDLEGNPLCQ